MLITNRVVKTAFSMLAFAMAFTVPAGARAQASADYPSVEIDTSILNELNPAAGAASAAGTYEVQPQRHVPSLTGYQGQTVSFPIQTRVKSESSNPSMPASEEVAPVAASSPAPVRTQTADAQKKTASVKPIDNAKTPLPGRKPGTVVRTVAVKPTVTPAAIPAAAPVETAAVTTPEKDLIKPPLPQRRPAIQKASPAFVQQARQEENRRQQEIKSEAVAPTKQAAKAAPVAAPVKIAKAVEPSSNRYVPRGPHAGPAMPAVRPTPVQGEALPMPPPSMGTATIDGLESQLVIPDKDELVKTIEAINKATKTHTTAAAPEAPQKIQAEKLTSRDERKPLKNKSGQKKDAEDAVAFFKEAIDGNTLEIPVTASADTVTASLPSLRIEQTQGMERVIVPFVQQAEKLDENLKNDLKSDILPLLRKNPDWQLQIRSYATGKEANPDVGAGKRLALARAVNTRYWLMDQGIEARRIDVVAMGQSDDENLPADRVDLVLLDN